MTFSSENDTNYIISWQLKIKLSKLTLHPLTGYIEVVCMVNMLYVTSYYSVSYSPAMSHVVTDLLGYYNYHMLPLPPPWLGGAERGFHISSPEVY